MAYFTPNFREVEQFIRDKNYAKVADALKYRTIGELGDFKKSKTDLLHLAVEVGDARIVELLCKRGVKTNVRSHSENGRTPLHLAAKKGDEFIVQILLDHMAVANEKDEDGCQPAHLAAKYGHVNVLKKLKQKGCDFQAVDSNGFTLMHYAAEGGYVHMVEWLQANQVHAWLKNNDRDSPIDITKKKGHIAMVNWFNKSERMSHLECNVCLESFNCEDRRPHCLTCGHSCCSSCLRDLLKQKTLICPYCRAPHRGQTNNVNDVPVIYALMSLIEGRTRETIDRDGVIRGLKKGTEDKICVQNTALEDQINSIRIQLKDFKGQVEVGVQVRKELGEVMKYLEKTEKLVQQDMESMETALSDAISVSESLVHFQKILNEATTLKEIISAEDECTVYVENAEPYLHRNKILISRKVLGNAQKVHSECTTFLAKVKGQMAEPEPALPPVRPQTRLFTPQKKALPQGLKSLGNRCYVNAVTQCLFNTSPLTEYVFSYAFRNHINYMSQSRGEIAHSFASVIHLLKNNEDSYTAMQNLKRKVEEQDRLFRGNWQQEAQDFLSTLLFSLDKDLTDFGKSHIADLFFGEHRSTITCMVRGELLSQRDEPFLCLALTVVDTTSNLSLQSLLENYYRPREIEWDCPGCNRSHPCQLEMKVLKLPKIMIIHFSRFSGGTPGRYKQLVDFPDVCNDFSNSVANGTERKRKYSLYGVCSHYGTMHSGHYVATCRNMRDKSQWFSFNDEEVREVSGPSKEGAHILFYEDVGQVDPSLEERAYGIASRVIQHMTYMRK